MERKEGGAEREWKKIQQKLEHWNKMLPFLDDSERMLDNTIFSLTRTGQEKWRVRPHEEFVHDIQTTLISKRMHYDSKGIAFDPLEWTNKHLTSLITSGNNADHKDSDAPPVVNRQVLDLCRAFQSISLPCIKNDEYKNNVSNLLRSEAAGRKNHIISIPPDSVRLLDALADAVDVPHSRHASNFDLLTHVRQNDSPRSKNNHDNDDSPPLPRTQGNLVRMRDGYLIDREFSGNDYPPSTRTLFIGDIRFTRGADDIFRADSDEQVIAQEEQHLRAMRNIFRGDKVMNSLQKDPELYEGATSRPITIDGQDGVFQTRPLRLIKGTRVTIAGQNGWFYPYPPGQLPPILPVELFDKALKTRKSGRTH
jgi:hypothetical protein